MANQHSTTRRTLVTGTVAALAAGSVVNLAAIVAKADADPILAVIERHRAAFAATCALLQEQNRLENEIRRAARRSNWILDKIEIAETDDPRWIDFTRRDFASSCALDDAATAMIEVRPTTMAGVLALLAYIDDFNRGTRSEHYIWPGELIDDKTMDGRGNPLEMPWAFWVMRNVQAALQSIRGTA